MTATNNQTNNGVDLKEKLINTYKEMVILGEAPINPYTVSKKAGISEEEFYKYFSTTEQIGRTIWKEIHEKVRQRLENSDIFAQYSAREKILAYLYTFFEVAIPYRSFIKATINKPFLQTSFKEEFETFVTDIIQEGIAADEIKERFIIGNAYPTILWGLLQRLIHFWLNDTSEQFVETEKAIDTYSKVILEFMGHNLMDSIFDSVKFALEHGKIFSNFEEVTNQIKDKKLFDFKINFKK